MEELDLLSRSIAAQISVTTRRLVRTEPNGDVAGCDRGSVSIEQVLWYAAAAVSVAIVAGIIWGKIQDQANTAVTTPGLGG